MKKSILVTLLIATALFSCTKTEDEPGKTSSKTDGLYELSGVMSDGSGGSGGSGSDNGQGGETPQSGQITAGEWHDLANWDFWNNLGQDSSFFKLPEYWSYNLSNRISVKLQNLASENLTDVTVELLNSGDKVIWTAKTDNFGTAELYPHLSPLGVSSTQNLKIRINNMVYSDFEFFNNGVNNIRINESRSELKTADIAFVVDATGSMGDELEYLKVELIDVIGKVKSANPSASINLGSVFYRDTEDEYITKISNFSTDINFTIDFIKNQSASGGGDFPEAVHTALKKAVNDLQWSTTATTRIIFLVLDAPPHYEPQIVSEIHNQISLAAGKGIKVIPVTASGIDKETEFLMRYMAIATNGTYVFITNDSGIGGEHLEATVGEYEVELLNNLIARLINKYLE